MLRFIEFRQLVRRFGDNRSGNFMVVAGVVIAVLVLAVGFGVGTAQLMNAKSALGAAVDAAVTSTTRDLTLGNVTEQQASASVKAFLDANSGGGGALPSGKIVLDRVTLNRSAYTVEVAAHVDVPLFFPVFGLEKTRRVSQTSAAAYSFRQIEVAMILDVTGSMKENDKIGALRTAAAKAVDIIFKDQNPNRPRVRVAVVPYANSVNVGSTLAASSVFVEPTANDRGQAPGSNEPRPPGSSYNPNGCATERKGAYQYTDDGPQASMVNRDYLLAEFVSQGNRGYGTRDCPEAAMMPLTADAAALKSRIASFAASGGTAGHIGIQWGWYMMSPKWAGALAQSQQPEPFDTTKVSKYAILMTDGEFNLSYFDVDSPDAVYNDYGKPATRNAATTLCTKMKAQGIEIFTIGFDLTEVNAKGTLQSCASPDTGGLRHFYQASTGTELEKAFTTIASNMQRLALTK